MGSTIIKSLPAVATSLLLGLGSASASMISDSNSAATPNGSLATAQNVEAGFSSGPPPANVPHAGDPAWEWVSIADSAPRFPVTSPYYSFNVSIGQTYIFDVDFGDEGSDANNAEDNFDSILDLFDGSGSFLAQNDDSGLDPGSISILDSYLEYTFFYNGMAAIRLSDFLGGGTEYGTYELQIARTSVVPVPAAVWLFGTALLGFVGMSRRTSIKA